MGRSMEPKIPDGSLCVFRRGVAGSRQGRLLLIQRFGADRTAEFTIKRYTSEKRAVEDGWEHARIRLEPLNPEFEPWDLAPDKFTVVGEFVRVLPPEE
jgi:SOS-response transcriptional repressor LexA